MINRCVLLAVSLFFPLTACSDGEPLWTGTMYDSAGVTIVSNPDVGIWTPGEEWVLEEEVRIGVQEGPPEYQFGFITGLGVLADGRIVVGDAMAQNVRFYSADGEHQLTVGRAGSGPGEFGPGGILILVGRGDTILAQDYAQGRVHRFSPDGTFLGMFSALPEDGQRYSGMWGDGPGGRIFSFSSVRASTPVDTLALVLAHDLNGMVLDTVIEMPSSTFQSETGAGFTYRFFPFESVFEYLWDGSFLTAYSSRYRLSWYEPSGKLSRIVTLNRQGQPLTEAEQDWIMEQFISRLRRQDRTAQEISDFREAMRFEDFYPAFRSIVSGPDSTIWVQRVRPLSALSPDELAHHTTRLPDSWEWDVLDRDGRYLGKVGFPPRFNLYRFHGDRAYGVWSDEFDVQYVVVLGLIRLQGTN